MRIGINPRQVRERISALAKSAIAEADAAELEVAAMPAGEHIVLRQTRQAVERRANLLLEQLQEGRDETDVKAGDGGGVHHGEAVGGAARQTD